MTENELDITTEQDIPIVTIDDRNEVKIEAELSSMFLKGGFKELRKLSKLSQKDIAERTGLSLKTISSIENPMNNDNNPTLKSLVRYLAVFGAELQVKKKIL